MPFDPPPGSSSAGTHPATTQQLSRQDRLRKRGEFSRVRRGGWAARSRFVVVAVLENDLGRRRLGVTVSSKVGKAVVRSRVKRWLREAYRRSREELPSGVDVVLIARPGSGEAGFDRIVAELEDLAKVLRSQADRPGHRRDRPGRIRDGT